MLGRIIISAVIIVLVLVWLAAICLMVMGPQNVAHISRGFYWTIFGVSRLIVGWFSGTSAPFDIHGNYCGIGVALAKSELKDFRIKSGTDLCAWPPKFWVIYLEAALPREMLDLMGRDLRQISLTQGRAIYEPGTPIDDIYFPQSGMISLLVVARDGGAIETATIGREGAVGLHGALGKRFSFTRATKWVTADVRFRILGGSLS
jgi:hypothetical protein